MKFEFKVPPPVQSHVVITLSEREAAQLYHMLDHKDIKQHAEKLEQYGYEETRKGITSFILYNVRTGNDMVSEDQRA